MAATAIAFPINETETDLQRAATFRISDGAEMYFLEEQRVADKA
jgi:hypothetical protein